jgi:glycosyltransferase involved in cell wall biosynthesis
LKILLLATEPQRGGVGRVIDLHAKALEAMGHDVAFAYFHRVTETHVLRADDRTEQVFYLDPEAGRSHLPSSLRFLSRVGALRRIVMHAEFDTVIAHGEGAAFVTALLPRRIETIAVLHGSVRYRWNYSKGLHYALIRARLKSAVRMNDKLVVVSKALADEVHDLLDYDAAHVIENCVDLDLFPEPSASGSAIKRTDSRLVLALVGRISREKNFVAIIRFVAALKTTGVPAQGIVVGDGPDRGEFLEAAVHAGLSVADFAARGQTPDPETIHDADIVITGFVADPSAWLPRADLFLLPSLSEGYPVALIEALATGLPAFASDCFTGPREIFGLSPRGFGEPGVKTAHLIEHRGMVLPIPIDPKTDRVWIDAIRAFAQHDERRAVLSVDVAAERARHGIDAFTRKWSNLLDA